MARAARVEGIAANTSTLYVSIFIYQFIYIYTFININICIYIYISLLGGDWGAAMARAARVERIAAHTSKLYV